MQGKLKRRLRMLCAAVTSAALVLCVVGGMSPAMAALGKPTATIGEKVFAFDGTPHHTTVTPPSDEYEVYYSTSKLTIANAKDRGTTEPVTRTNAGRTNVYYAIVPVSETPTSANSVASYFSLQVTKGSMANVTIADIPDQPLVAGGAKPELTVTDASGYELALGRDYTVRWANNAKIGTATVTVSGYANYSGSKVASFNVCTEHSTVGAVPTYTWSGSGSDPSDWTCTAMLACTAEGHTDVALTVGTVTRTSYTEATCTAAGSACFSAAFDAEWAQPQVKVVEQPALGHAVGDVAWTWADDGKSASAELSCTRCGSSERADAYVTSKTAVAAGCTEAGEHTYTANVTLGGKRYTAAKNVADIPARGHTYAKTVSWAADNKSATVHLACPVCDAVRDFGFAIGETSFTFDGSDHPVSITSDNESFKVYYSTSKLYPDNADVAGSQEPLSVRDAGQKAIYYIVVPADETPTAKNTASGYVTAKVAKRPMTDVAVDPIPDQQLAEGVARPALRVVDNSNGYELQEGTDYTVNYYNNTRLGRAYAIVTGYLNYNGRLGKQYFNIGEAPQHTFGDVSYVWSGEGSNPSDWTCTATATCTASGHTDSLVVNGTVTRTDYTEPTCTADGSATFKATFAEGWASEQTHVVAIAALGHNYNAGTIAFAADGKTATATFTCANGCGVKEEKAAAVTSVVKTAATCTAMGTTTYTASATSSTNKVISATKDVTDIAALGHDLVSHDAKAPTCTDIGWDAYDTCSRCDYTTYVEKAALGHNYDSVVTEPTCAEGGYTTHTCTRCDDSYVDANVDALGHNCAVSEMVIDGNGVQFSHYTCQRVGCDYGYWKNDSTGATGVTKEEVGYVEAVPELIAFAVYSADDESLNFYKRASVPTAGDNFNGKTATAVYTGIETDDYSTNYGAPWKSYRSSITSVSFVDSGITPVSTAYWFDYMNNASLTTIGGLDKLDTSKVTTMSSMFNSCTALTSLDVSSFDTANVTSMHYMFNDCSALTSLDVSNFNTSNVTYMDNMFAFCSALTTLDLSSFNTANVTRMYKMFYCCYDLATLDVSSFDTSKVTNMGSMFGGCWALLTLDVSNFDTANVTDMSSMFGNCSALTSLDLSNFNTSKVTNMKQMFDSCSKLTSLDVSHFNTANVTDMQAMFRNSKALTSLDVSRFDTSNVTNMRDMFNNCPALTSLDVSSFDTANVTDMQTMFKGCEALSNIYVSDKWNTASVTNSSLMFYECTKLPNYSTSKGDKTNAHVGDGGHLTCVGFKDGGSGHQVTGCTCSLCGGAVHNPVDGYCSRCGADCRIAFAVYSADDNSLNFYKRGAVPAAGDTFNGKTATAVYTGIETDTYSSSTQPWKSYRFPITSVSFEDEGIAPVSTAYWFYQMNNASFTTIGGLDKLDTSNVTDMSGMFANCSKLTNLDLSSFNTANVTNMSQMFYYCSKLTSLNVSNFDTANVTGMGSMFTNCYALSSLDLSSFDTANVTDMEMMFYYDSALSKIYVSDKWSVRNVTSSSNMFYNCSKLPNYRSSYLDKTRAHYSTGGYLTYKAS